jgi:streptomycin 6-kinase
MACKKGENLVTVTGIIIPVDWKGDRVVAAAIATAREEEYFIARNRKGGELLKFLQEPIEAEGVVGTDEDGRMTIRVKRYTVKS